MIWDKRIGNKEDVLTYGLKVEGGDGMVDGKDSIRMNGLEKRNMKNRLERAEDVKMNRLKKKYLWMIEMYTQAN